MTKSDLVGVWQLESFELGSGTGAKQWGERLRGLLFYTSDNFVSVAINRNVGAANFDSANDSLFYAGTYQIQGRQIVHEIQVATASERIDSLLVRNASVSSDKLILSGENPSGSVFKVVWART